MIINGGFLTIGTKRVGMARVKSLINENVNQMKLKLPQIIRVSGTRLLTAEESGAKIYWTLSSAHHITLPDATVGMNFSFVIEKNGTNGQAHTIISQAADKIHGTALLMKSGAADKCNSLVINHGSGVDKVYFQNNGTDFGGQAGSTCELTCVEAGKWVATVIQTTTATPAGTLTTLAA